MEKSPPKKAPQASAGKKAPAGHKTETPLLGGRGAAKRYDTFGPGVSMARRVGGIALEALNEGWLEHETARVAHLLRGSGDVSSVKTDQLVLVDTMYEPALGVWSYGVNRAQLRRRAQHYADTSPPERIDMERLCNDLRVAGAPFLLRLYYTIIVSLVRMRFSFYLAVEHKLLRLDPPPPRGGFVGRAAERVLGGVDHLVDFYVLVYNRLDTEYHRALSGPGAPFPHPSSGKRHRRHHRSHRRHHHTQNGTVGGGSRSHHGASGTSSGGHHGKSRDAAVVPSSSSARSRAGVAPLPTAYVRVKQHRTQRSVGAKDDDAASFYSSSSSSSTSSSVSSSSSSSTSSTLSIASANGSPGVPLLQTKAVEEELTRLGEGSACGNSSDSFSDLAESNSDDELDDSADAVVARALKRSQASKQRAKAAKAAKAADAFVAIPPHRASGRSVTLPSTLPGVRRMQDLQTMTLKRVVSTNTGTQTRVVRTLSMPSVASPRLYVDTQPSLATSPRRAKEQPDGEKKA